MCEGLVGQVFNLRPISIGLPTSVPMPPRRVENPPQVENLPHIRQCYRAGVSLYSPAPWGATRKV